MYLEGKHSKYSASVNLLLSRRFTRASFRFNTRSVCDNRRRNPYQIPKTVPPGNSTGVGSFLSRCFIRASLRFSARPAPKAVGSAEFLPGSAQNVENDVTYSKQTIGKFLGKYPLTTSVLESSLRHVFGIYSCYGQRKCRVAMLTAYFDESGIHEGDHLCVVAGYIGNEAQWASFAAEWIPALGKRKNLHMKELRWSKPKRIERLLAKLGPIPERHNLFPVFGGVWQRDYDAVIKGKVKKTFSTPYMLAAQVCMHASLEFTSKSDDIGFVFHRQDNFEDSMQRLGDVVFNVAKLEPRVKGITFLAQEATVCLDPADYLAFQLREFWTDKDSLRSKLGAPIMKNPKRGVGSIYNRERLKGLADTLIAQGYAAQ
jgi:hypothetical protein